MVVHVGFGEGRVLDLACNTGLFVALAPDAPATTWHFIGIEADSITAKIARACSILTALSAPSCYQSKTAASLLCGDRGSQSTSERWDAAISTWLHRDASSPSHSCSAVPCADRCRSVH
jgi:hypothetical protein